MQTSYNIMSRILALLIILPFMYSCNSPAAAYEPLKKEVTYAKVADSRIKYTKHVREQQKDICKRLKRIQKKLEKKNKKG
tara:strand:+ start:321 stop:560 length:240 start_codon:yes stop_codon:yes gene_type:complete